MASFGNFIKQKREGHLWTQTELGAKIGINSSAISRIEHGTKQLSPNKLPVIAKLFDVELNKVKEIYYGDKFAREVYKTGCPETVFTVAEEAVKYLKTKSNNTNTIIFE